MDMQNISRICFEHEKIEKKYVKDTLEEFDPYKVGKITKLKLRKLRKLRSQCIHEYIRYVYFRPNTKTIYMLNVCVACGKIERKNMPKKMTKEEKEEISSIVTKYFRMHLKKMGIYKPCYLSIITHNELVSQIAKITEKI